MNECKFRIEVLNLIYQRKDKCNQNEKLQKILLSCHSALTFSESITLFLKYKYNHFDSSADHFLPLREEELFAYWKAACRIGSSICVQGNAC